MAGEVEAELKFELRREDLEALRAVRSFAGFRSGPVTKDGLKSRYFDSADGRLKAAGVALRIREHGGGFEQTVKFGRVEGGTLSAREEATVAVEERLPDLARFGEDVAARLAGILADAPLQERFVVAVDRTVRHLVHRDGDEVEFALDEGTVAAGDAVEPVLEAEFELKAGDLPALFTVARQVMKGVPVRFARGSKASRGHQLAEGREPAGWRPLKAADHPIDPEASVEAALQAVLRSCIEQITVNAVVVQECEDPEGPHQLRVGLRRFRSALKLYRPIISQGTARRLEAEVKWLAGEVGALRDLDVLIEEIVAPCAGRVDASGLLDVLRLRQRETRDHLVATLRGPRCGQLLIDLAGYVEGRGWLSFSDLHQSQALAAPVADFAAEAISRRWHKVAKIGKRIDELDGEERHDLRKGFKTLRYAIDFFGDTLKDRDRRKLMKDVKAAQELLGYLNDVRMAHGLADIVAGAAGSDGARKGQGGAAVERAIGFCLGWHEAHAERAWEKAREVARLDPKEV